MTAGWTRGEELRLMELYPRVGKMAAARALNKTPGQIAGKARILNLMAPATGRGFEIKSSHEAARTGRTMFRSTVRTPDGPIPVLKTGADTSKLGKEVTKGPWRGMPIYSLTLEERATCPTDCGHWLDCYGNSMGLARRYVAGPELEERICREVERLAQLHPAGFVVRLHILGDFYSVGYVDLWVALIGLFPALHVFGYTARQPDTPIGSMIVKARALCWPRLMIRISGEDCGALRAITLYDQDPAPRHAVICPAEQGKTRNCGTCGLCWAENFQGKTIAFRMHGGRR